MRSGIDLTDFLDLKRTVQQRIEMLFNVLDPDDNGYISDDDLRLIINTVRYGHTPEEVDAMIQLADNDEDGQITPIELVELFFVRNDTPRYTYNPPPRPDYISPPDPTNTDRLDVEEPNLQSQQVNSPDVVVSVRLP